MEICGIKTRFLPYPHSFFFNRPLLPLTSTKFGVCDKCRAEQELQRCSQLWGWGPPCPVGDGEALLLIKASGLAKLLGVWALKLASLGRTEGSAVLLTVILACWLI